MNSIEKCPSLTRHAFKVYLWSAGIFAALVAPSLSSDIIYRDGDMVMKVLERSGKMSVFQVNNNSATPRREKGITLEFDDITETDGKGVPVHCPGHFYRNFADTDFEVSDLEPKKVGQMDTMYLNYSVSLQEGRSKLRVHVHFFKESGSRRIIDETVHVLSGDVNMRLELQNWTFCESSNGPDDSARGEEKRGQPGTELRVRFAVKGTPNKAIRRIGVGEKRKNGRKNSTRSDQIDFGEDLVLVLSRSITMGSENWPMKTGFPAFTTRGSQALVTVVFPKSERVVYEQTLQVADPEGYSLPEVEDTEIEHKLTVNGCMVLSRWFGGVVYVWATISLQLLFFVRGI